MVTSAPGEGRVELARAKAGLYGLLARVFGGKPSPELVRGMKDRQMLDSLAAFGISFDEDFLAGSEEELAGELAVEYTRLFVGPGPHIAAYESVYVRGEGEGEPRLWGRMTAEVAEFYREAALQIPEGRTPDHLGVELEAMALLAREEAGKLEAGDKAGAGRLDELQRRFCEEHLLRWVPEVCREVEGAARSSFYRSMAALAAEMVGIACGEEDRVL